MLRYRSLLLVVLLGIVPIMALIAGVWIYVNEPEPPSEPEVVEAPPPPPDPPPVEVFVTTHDLLAGTLLTANDITTVERGPETVASRDLTAEKVELSNIIGSVARVPILTATPLSWAVLVRPGQEGFLAAALMPNHRAVTIEVNKETSHAGLIAPGDRVDVIFTMEVQDETGEQTGGAFSRTVLENIRVVAVGRRVESRIVAEGEGEGEEEQAERQVDTVTLEVLPVEADQLVLVATNGRVSLALRPLGQDTQFSRRQPVGLRALLPAPAADQLEPVRVQVFRGTSSEEVLLAQ